MVSRSDLALVGVVGDVHGEDKHLEAAIAFLQRAGVDRILAVGDIVDGDGDADRCCRLLADCGALVVRGNHDRWLLKDTMRDARDADHAAELSESSRDFLASLPPSRVLPTVSGTLLLCHGLLDNDMRTLTADDYGYELQCNDELQALLARSDIRFVINGHTHRRMVRRFEHVAVLNAGTLRRTDAPCVMIVDFARQEARFHDILANATFGAAEMLPFS